VAKPRKRFLNPELRAAIARQRKANASTAAQRQRFASHRARVTELVRGAAHRSALCVLGAGNCNDLDLDVVAEAYDEVHLVDLDERAVTAAAARVSADRRGRFVVHAPLDISGLVDALPRWKAMQVSEEGLLRFPQTVAQAVATKLGRHFDCVLSGCVLTQLQLMVVDVLGDQHRLFAAASQTTLLTHLRLLDALLAPSGEAFLVTELAAVEAESAPRDASELLAELVASGGGFSIAYPPLLSATIEDDPLLARGIRAEVLRPAWYWHQGPDRSYVTYAMQLSRRAGES